MKDKILAATAVLAVIAAVFSVISFFYIRTERCRNRYDRCVEECDRTRDRALSENDIQRGQIEFQLLQDLSDCRIQNLLDRQASEQCQTEKKTAAEAELAQLNAQDDAIRAAREQCVAAECRRQARECEDEIEFLGEVPSTAVPVEVECIEGNNAPCFKEVLEICTKISGPCDNCWRSLCGDGTWSFESDVPLDVTLVAATDPRKDARVLSTSSMNGKQAALPLQKQIKLKGREQLYIGFSSKQKPTGPVKVLIHRSK